MASRQFSRWTLLSLGLGLALLVYSFFVAYNAYPPQPLPPNGDSFGLAMIVVVPASLLGGLLVSHGMYRQISDKQLSLKSLLLYPVVTGLLVSISMGYLIYSPNFDGSPFIWIGVGLLIGLLAAGGVLAVNELRR